MPVTDLGMTATLYPVRRRVEYSEEGGGEFVISHKNEFGRHKYSKRHPSMGFWTLQGHNSRSYIVPPGL